MQGKIGICGIVVAGLAMLAPASSFADDKADVLPGPIDSLSDLQDTAKLVFKLADTNGDGVLTQQEAQQAREALFAQQPLLKFVVMRAKPTNAPQGNQSQNLQPVATGAANDPRQVAQSFAADPMGAITSLLDTNRDQKIEATELRQAVQAGVNTLFLLADSNQDNQLSPYELNAAVGEIGKAAVQSVFQAADADRNNAVSMDEFDKALIEPAHSMFRVLDANADNQLTMAELERAAQIIKDQIQRLRVPEPANSISHQIQGGRNANRNQPPPYQTTPGSAGAPAPGAAATPAPPR